MSLLVHFRPEAEADLRVGYEWYEAQQPGLGEDFLDRVDAAITHISASRSLPQSSTATSVATS